MDTSVRRRPAPLDLVIAGALALAAQVEVWASPLVPGVGEVTGSPLILSVTALAMTLPLALRRVWPLAACLVPLAAACVEQLLTTPTEGMASLVALLVASYSVAAHGRQVEVWAGGVGVLISSFLIGGRGDGFFVLVLLGSAWLGGMLVGRGTVQVTRLRADKEDLERRRLEAAERGAAEERVRIAGDLHDVVAHRVSLMVVQAQAADALLADSPDRAREALGAVEGAGREALRELRSLLGLLHTGAEAEDRSPQPGLDAIETLVADARTAGVSVDLQRHGEPRPVAPVVAMAAYRVVQEAITNVVKHAGCAPTTILICFTPDRLEVVVDDDGNAPDGPSLPGFGIAGLSERVGFAGGELETGPRPGGGFRVRALLPAPHAAAG